MHENIEIKQEKLRIFKEKLFLQREKLEYLKNIHSNFKNIFNNIDYNIKCLKEEMEKNSTFISHIIIKNWYIKYKYKKTIIIIHNSI